MITLTGKRVSEGIVIGRLVFFNRGEREIRKIYVEDAEKEQRQSCRSFTMSRRASWVRPMR